MLSLLHEPTAFAFKYGFDKESDFKTDSPTNVVFYDLGMTSYKARANATVFLAHTQLSQSIWAAWQGSVVSFSAALGKKNKTQGTMQVRGLGWDSSLGGRDFDMIVFDMLAEEFNSKCVLSAYWEDVHRLQRSPCVMMGCLLVVKASPIKTPLLCWLPAGPSKARTMFVITRRRCAVGLLHTHYGCWLTTV